jgi:PIN domain nuclease of toxin-antitoxin system
VIFVLDASAMIAFLRDERGADVVAEALLEAESQCFAHALNLCEVFYDFHRASGRPDAFQAIVDLAQVGVTEDANLTPDVWQAAGTLKAELRRVSLADCFAIELAARLRGTVLTADHHEFDALAERSVCAIRFIR